MTGVGNWARGAARLSLNSTQAVVTQARIETPTKVNCLNSTPTPRELVLLYFSMAWLLSVVVKRGVVELEVRTARLRKTQGWCGLSVLLVFYLSEYHSWGAVKWELEGLEP